MYVVIMAMICAGTYLYKHRTKVEFEQTDMSMNRSFTPGASYPVDISPCSIKQIQRNDVVAYWLPDDPDKNRVARVVAIEGDQIKCDAEGFHFNGTKTAYKFDNRPDWRFPELRVPRGCLFLLADQSDMARDSMQLGPVPFYQVIGKVTPGLKQ
jgi:signal peptidase I